MTYDYLILATGADYSFFGHDDWAEHAPVLKTVNDALRIRERLLNALEEAERSDDQDAIRRLLTFVVIGGGPTGVELAGAIAELTRSSLAEDFRRVSGHEPTILLVEAGKTVLGAFSVKQSEYAMKALRQLGVTIMLGQPVETVDAGGVMVGGSRIDSGNVFWCAGTQARPAAAWIGADAARNKGVVVNADCSVAGHPDIFAIGDVASYRQPDGSILPGLAPVAKQQGRYVGKLIAARCANHPDPDPFRYRNWGTMAVIGRSKAIADFGTIKLNGFVAWLSWSLVHLWLLVSFRNRLTVYVNWAWAWWTHGRGVRLLTRPVTAHSDPQVSSNLPSR